MLWVKLFHIFAVISWFAGIFYLPRILVNLALLSPQEDSTRERLILMAQKLWRFMWWPAIVAIVLGLWYWVKVWGLGAGTAWLHAKTTLVLLLVFYHIACGRFLQEFKNKTQGKSHIWFRWFNEVPVLLLLLILILVVFKPF